MLPTPQMTSAASQTLLGTSREIRPPREATILRPLPSSFCWRRLPLPRQYRCVCVPLRLIGLCLNNCISVASQCIHAFIPEPVGSGADRDNDAATQCDDDADLDTSSGLAGLLISVSRSGEIDIRRVKEPCTLREEQTRNPEDIQLVEARLRDIAAFRLSSDASKVSSQ